MQALLKKMVQNQLIMAIVSILLGIALIIYQGRAVAEITLVVGYLLLAGAAVYLVSYFIGGANKGNPSTLASCILCILFGVICVMRPGWLVTLLPILMGISLILSSITNLSVLASQRGRGGMALLLGVFSVVTLVFGVVAIMNPVAMANFLVCFIGVSYLINGLGDLLAIALMR